MAYNLSRQTAQKIVDTVKDVCGHDINYINRDGIIFASTNPDRIGDFHEIGKQVVATKETLIVDSDDSFYGTQKGINIPFIYNHESIAAIGISGDPSEVRQFAVLAEKITSLILKEQELDSERFGEKSKINYVIRTLINGESINHEYLMEFLEKKKLSDAKKYRIVLVRLFSRYNTSNLSLIEDSLFRAFEQIPESVYTFNYPNEYILMVTDDMYKKWDYIFETLAGKYFGILQIGVGSDFAIHKQNISYESAVIAANSLPSDKNLAVFEKLDLEILLGCINKEVKDQYLSKTTQALDPEDFNLLKTYFNLDMSLKATADKLFLHINTLQYKLNRIHRLSGYNPRNFRDAVVLYLAVKL